VSGQRTEFQLGILAAQLGAQRLFAAFETRQPLLHARMAHEIKVGRRRSAERGGQRVGLRHGPDIQLHRRVGMQAERAQQSVPARDRLGRAAGAGRFKGQPFLREAFALVGRQLAGGHQRGDLPLALGEACQIGLLRGRAASVGRAGEPAPLDLRQQLALGGDHGQGVGARVGERGALLEAGHAGQRQAEAQAGAEDPGMRTAAQHAQRLQVEGGVLPPAGGEGLAVGVLAAEAQRVDLGIEDPREVARRRGRERDAVRDGGRPGGGFAGPVDRRRGNAAASGGDYGPYRQNE